MTKISKKTWGLILLSILVCLPLCLYIQGNIAVIKAENYLKARGVQIESRYARMCNTFTLRLSHISISAEDCKRLEILAPHVTDLAFVNCTLQKEAVLPSFPNLYFFENIKKGNVNETIAMPSEALSKLRWIIFSGIVLDKMDYEFIQLSPNIGIVYISSSDIHSVFFHGMSSIEKWSNVCFLNSTLEKGCLEYLSTRANSLKIIDLGRTNISDESLLVLPQGIEIVDIRNTAVTSKGVVAMITSKRYSHLEKIGTDLDFTNEEASIIKKHNIEIVTEYYWM